MRMVHANSANSVRRVNQLDGWSMKVVNNGRDLMIELFSRIRCVRTTILRQDNNSM
jgi:hypothetical protein